MQVFFLASILKFVFIMMHLNHCIILFVEERIWCIDVSKILSLNLELFGIYVKGLVGHRGMAPAVAYNYVLMVIMLILTLNTLSVNMVNVVHVNNRYYFHCYSLY